MKAKDLEEYVKSKGKDKEKEVEEPVDQSATIENLAARVFAARDAAHREHWKTNSIAKHEALGSFYGDVIEQIDTIIELDQGMYGLIGAFEVEDSQPNDIISFLRDEAKWIESNRDKFSKCQAVLNQIDELTGIYLRTVYKLTNLL